VRIMSPQYQLVSIVVPIFNEEDGVQQLKQKLLALSELLSPQYDLEFILVDDGSSDNTVLRLRQEFAGSPFRWQVLEHGTNRGVGAAFRTGFDFANGNLVCTIDADCSYEPEGLQLLLEELRTSRTDIAVASPYHPEGGVEGVPAWRLVLSKGCSTLYWVLSPLKLYTYTSIFRAYRAEVVKEVSFKADGFVSAAEILVLAGRRGYAVSEVPMVLRGRKVGRSKMKIMRTVLTHLKMLSSLLVPAGPVPVARPIAVRRPLQAAKFGNEVQRG